MKTRFFLCVEQGQASQCRPALCLTTDTETWFMFNDVFGVRFRRRDAVVTADFTPEEMKKQYMGVYRLMAMKWNAISKILADSGVKEEVPV